MVAFTYRMPAGIPGDINRASAALVEPGVITPVGTSGAPTAYGIPLVVDATAGNVGNMRTVQAADTNVYGLLARPFPTGGSQDGLNVSTPPSQGTCDVMVRGYMTVLLSGVAAATKGAPVFIWTATSASNHPQGGFEAVASSGSTLALPSSYFMGPADASGNVEIGFRI